jgi:hypothetical protein
MKIRNIIAIGLTATVSIACMTGSKTSVLKRSEIKKRFQTGMRRPAQAANRFAESHSAPSLESQLGNALLENTGKGVVLSIPAAIQKSSYHPFGDGQSNAKMGLGSWTQPGFPAVGIQTGSGTEAKRTYVFNPSLGIKDYKETKVGSSWFKVQPTGWADSFYFSFDTETLPVSEFVKGIPATLRTFADGRVAPDLARIGKITGVDKFKNLGAGYNVDPYYNDNVHGRFPDANGAKTAVGGVLTWGITDKAFGPFKNLYTCFEARDFGKEKELGIPSGAGWHHIGDAAETLLNTLSQSALPVAVARTHAQTGAAFGLSEVITATWLQSDEALVTTQGEFHWYLNPYPESVCTEIWVHNCVPNLSNNWGFNCH